MTVRILDKKALRGKGVKFSNVHLLRLEKQGKFPSRFNISDNRVAWLEQEVDAWIAELAAAPKRPMLLNTSRRKRPKVGDAQPPAAPVPTAPVAPPVRPRRRGKGMSDARPAA